MITLRPRILGIRNDLFKRSSGRKKILLAVLLLVGMGWILFQGTSSLLKEIAKTELPEDEAGFLSFLGVLYALLFFSGATRGLATLYLSKDIELYLSSPVSRVKFYTGKIIEVCIETLWSILILGTPVLAAFWIEDYNVLPLLVTLLPFFVQPIFLGIIVISLLVNLVSASKLREIALGLLFLSIIIGSVLIITQSGSEIQLIEKFKDWIALDYIKSFLPPAVAADLISSSIEGDELSFKLAAFIWGIAIILGIISLIVLQKFHSRGYTLSLASDRRAKSYGDGISLFKHLPSQVRAMVVKELKLFIREPSQAIQLAFFLFVCLLYMYNLREIAPLSEVPDHLKIWGKLILVAFNLTVAGFITSAVSTRFAFTASSIEGGSFYIIQTSPISLSKFLYSKFALWCTLIAVLAMTISTSGALALGGEPHLILLTAFLTPCWTIGIVGLSIGLGSIFARFDWDNASQLSFSIGSLVTMLATTGLVVANALGATLLIAISNSEKLWVGYAVLFTALTLIANIVIANLSLKAGEKALAYR